MENIYLKPYYPLVDFLADFLGEQTEVALYDFSDLSHSIVKIRNGFISGHKEGDPATTTVMEAVQYQCSGGHTCRYRPQPNGTGTLKNGAFYIRDAKGYVVGMLSLNTDINNLMAIQDFIRSFLGHHAAPDVKENVNSQAGPSGRFSPEQLDAAIAHALSIFPGSPQRLTPAEREQAVSRMNSEGIFLIRGSVERAALALGISESSMYRYLKKLKAR